MKVSMIVWCIAALCIGRATAHAADKQPIALAIFAFENNSIDEKERLDPLKKGIADMFTTRLSKLRSVKVVERQRMQALLEELQLNETDMVNPATALKVGKLLGAHILVFGGYTSITRDDFRIDVRLVDTETGETLDAEEETGSVDEVLPMVTTLVKKITIALEGLDR